MSDKLNATEKIIALLECVAGPGHNKRVAQIAELLDMDRATVYRLAGQLAELEMLSIDPDTRRITIGSRAYHIGYAYVRGSSMAARVNLCLTEASKQMPMLISLAIVDSRIKEGYVFDLFNVSTMHQWGVRYEEGIYKPVNHDSHGRLLMAYYEPQEEMERIIRSIPLTAVNKKSFTDPEALLPEYECIRRQGMCISIGVVTPGINGVAMPIHSKEGKVIASVSADVDAEGWEEGKKERLIAIVRDCVEKIERLVFDGVTDRNWLK